MKNRTMVELLCIFAVYLLYWGLIYMMVTQDAARDLGVTPGMENGKPMDAARFREDLNTWSMILMGISLTAALAWYALGEWGLKAFRTSDSTWMVIWVALLAVTLAGAFGAVFMGPPAGTGGDILALYYFLGAAGFYCFATILFSPADTRYIPPLAKQIRRGW